MDSNCGYISDEKYQIRYHRLMTTFVGRFAELHKLEAELGRVRSGASAHGRCVVVTGAAAAGKTRLIGEFIRRSRTRAWWFSPADHVGVGAGSADPAAILAAFTEGAAASALPGAQRFTDILVPDWDTALRLLGEAVAGGEPTVVVLDDVTLLLHAGRDFGTALRRAWERSLRDAPVLLVLAGSDGDRRGGELSELLPIGGVAAVDVAPFNPAELAGVLSLSAADALDVYITTGGHADIAAQWPTGSGAAEGLSAMLGRSPSVFEIRGEMHLARQLGFGSQRAAVLAATGYASCSRAAIGRIAALPPASLDRALKQLVADGYLVVDRPVSLHPSREARYRLADPYLRFWLRAIAPQRQAIARGDMDSVIAELHARWPVWRRDAMSITARVAMHRLATAGHLPGTGAVGGFWNRFEDTRVDLVGTDRQDDPRAVTFVGAFKWDAATPFDHFDLGSLIAARTQVPGVTDTTPLVAVSLAGATVGDAVAAVLGPNELMSAWQA